MAHVTRKSRGGFRHIQVLQRCCQEPVSLHLLDPLPSVWTSFPDRLSHQQQQVYILPRWQQKSLDWVSLEQIGPVPIPGQGEGMFRWARPRLWVSLCDWGRGRTYLATQTERGESFPKDIHSVANWRKKRGWRLA